MKLIKVTFTAISGGNRGFRLSVAMYNLQEKIFHNLRKKNFITKYISLKRMKRRILEMQLRPKPSIYSFFQTRV